MSCPYKNNPNQSFMSKMVDNENRSTSHDQEKAIPKTCPYAKVSDPNTPNPHLTQNKTEAIPETSEKQKDEKLDEESEDEQNTGGCPVMNKSKLYT